jgi:hypothetical protein
MPVAEVSYDLRRCSNEVPPAEGCDAGLVAKGKRRRRVMRAGDGRELSRVNRKGPVAAWCNPLMRKTGAQHRWLGGLRILFGVSSTHAFFFEGGGLCGQCGTIREGGHLWIESGCEQVGGVSHSIRHPSCDIWDCKFQFWIPPQCQHPNTVLLFEVRVTSVRHQISIQSPDPSLALCTSATRHHSQLQSPRRSADLLIVMAGLVASSLSLSLLLELPAAPTCHGST